MALKRQMLMVGDAVQWGEGHETPWKGIVIEVREDAAVVRFGADEFMVRLEELEIEVRVTRCAPGVAEGAMDGRLINGLLGGPQSMEGLKSMLMRNGGRRWA